MAERACALWALLVAAPGVLALEDLLVGAFMLFIATGAVEPRASIFNTPHGLGMSVPALLEALQRRYPGETSACPCWRLHWSEGANLHLLHELLAPLWHREPVPGRLKWQKPLGTLSRRPTRHHSPNRCLGKSTNQCLQASKIPAPTQRLQDSGGLSGTQTHTPLDPTKRITPPFRCHTPRNQGTSKSVFAPTPSLSNSRGNGTTGPKFPPTYRATDPMYNA